jgi:hypothetical protein
MHQIKLLREMGHIEARFSLFGDSVSFGARSVHGFRQTYHRLRKSFWTHRMVLLGDEAQMEAHFGPFGDSANLDSR